MNEPDTQVVEQTVRIRARPEAVWRYWTDPRRMCDWWGVATDLDPQPGGTCVVTVGDRAVMRGEYLELVPFERIVFSFGWDPAPDGPDVPPGSTRVEVTLTLDAGDTLLTLRHTGIPAAEADRHRAGWGYFLPLLADTAARTDNEETAR